MLAACAFSFEVRPNLPALSLSKGGGRLMKAARGLPSELVMTFGAPFHHNLSRPADPAYSKLGNSTRDNEQPEQSS
jgi:hypothetical protein